MKRYVPLIAVCFVLITIFSVVMQFATGATLMTIFASDDVVEPPNYGKWKK